MKSPQRRAWFGAIGAALLLVGASVCASESDDTADSPPAVAAEPAVSGTDAPTAASTAPTDTAAPGSAVGSPDPTAPAVVVPEALQFTAPLVGGGTFDGPAAAGKPTVFWFWAPT